MSDHHPHRHPSYYNKDTYVSSKRYHSPSESARVGVGGGYYDSASKRSRGEHYGSSGGHLHTSSASSRYNDYSSASSHGHSSSTMSSRFSKPSSSSAHYYDSHGGSKSSKYVDDFKGSSSRSVGMKSSVRRIPPQLSAPSYSKSPVKSSVGSSSRPTPLMKLNTATSSGTSSGRDYGGSRVRTAPPEHHTTSYVSSTFRKPEFKRPVPSYASRYSTGSSSISRPFIGSSSQRRGILRPSAASLNAKLRRRAVESIEERRRRITAYHSSRREQEQKRAARYYGKTASKERSSKDREDRVKERDSSADGKRRSSKQHDDISERDNEVETAVVVEEVCGDSDEDDNLDHSKDTDTEHGDKSERTRLDSETLSHNDVDDSKMDTDDKPKDIEGKRERDTTSADKSTGESGKDKSKSDKKTEEDREESPSSRALLKLYCKYCDVRHVTFREYSTHLRSYSHTKAMHTAVADMRRQLSKLRTQQRDDQRKLEKEEKVLSDTTSYCRVCELNFRTDPKEHEANVLHNEIKTVIYKRCDVCEIDFRIWKVYLYHLAALEHVKRVAMKELKEAELKGENVKGTNLSQEELGLDLVEVRTVFFCNACVRYLPFKGDVDEAKNRHCMTLTHIKYVEEFRQREKRIAKRQKERMLEREKEEKLKKDKEVEDGHETDSTVNTSDETKQDDEAARNDESGNTEADSTVANIKKEHGDTDNDKVNEPINVDVAGIKIKQEKNSDTLADEVNTEENNENVDEEVDEDEIELHAGDDVPEDDEEEINESSSWNRRTTRSSGRKGASSGKAAV